MATVKVYRLAYCFENGQSVANIKYSNWVRIADLDDVVSNVNSVHQASENSSEGVSPTILGWEEKELDTDPS